MQLPDFIKRALAFFEKAEEQFKTSEAAKGRITDLEQANAKLTKDLADAQAKLDKAGTDLTVKDTEIAKLKGDLTKEQGRANATIAAQGLPTDQLPASAPKAGEEDKESAWQKYQRLLAENPRAAGQYWADEADKIIKTRFEK